MVGGRNKTAEIDDNKFGRWKYRRDHRLCRDRAVEGQWVFGAVENEPERTFLVPVPDRIAGNRMTLIIARSNAEFHHH